MHDVFLTKLRALPPKPKRKQSALRTRIGETFDDIAAAKSRGVTWKAITALMVETGVTAADGTSLTAAIVNSAFAAEKAARSERKRGRSKKKLDPVQPSPAISDSHPVPDEDPLGKIRREMQVRSGRKTS